MSLFLPNLKKFFTAYDIIFVFCFSFLIFVSSFYLNLPKNTINSQKEIEKRKAFTNFVKAFFLIILFSILLYFRIFFLITTTPAIMIAQIVIPNTAYSVGLVVP